MLPIYCRDAPFGYPSRSVRSSDSFVWVGVWTRWECKHGQQQSRRGLYLAGYSHWWIEGWWQRLLLLFLFSIGFCSEYIGEGGSLYLMVICRQNFMATRVFAFNERPTGIIAIALPTHARLQKKTKKSGECWLLGQALGWLHHRFIHLLANDKLVGLGIRNRCQVETRGFLRWRRRIDSIYPVSTVTPFLSLSFLAANANASRRKRSGSWEGEEEE